MSRTDTLKSYGETLVGTGRTGLLAALGAGDVAVDRARTVVTGLWSRAEALPGEAQVQADLGVKEARTRVETAREQARRAAVQARTTVGELRPETVIGTVTGLVEAARTQALGAVGELAGRGEQLVGDLRRQPAFRTVLARTERAVDAVEDGLEDALEETGETVSAASDAVTSTVQQTAARTDAAVDAATTDVRDAAEATKATVAEAADAAPAPTATPAATTPVAAAEPVREPAAEAALPDPLAVPRKKRTTK
jgi:heparin binding hemagglutinin HbhA